MIFGLFLLPGGRPRRLGEGLVVQPLVAQVGQSELSLVQLAQVQPRVGLQGIVR